MGAEVYPRSHGSLSGLSGTDHHPQYALVTSGAFAARPTGPYRAGRMYYSTDTGILSWDQGAGWVDFAVAQAALDDLSALAWMTVAP